jgi:hypothetical protein
MAEGSFRSSPVRWLAALLMFALPPVAWAALGENESSIAAEQAQMRASLRITRTATHAVHELQTPAGHLIREYVSPSGTVFGVAWQGPSKPDLKQLLGSHFNEVQQSAQPAPIRRGPVVIRQPGLVFEMGGHPGAFAGRAYIPQLLPAGVQAEAVR